MHGLATRARPTTSAARAARTSSTRTPKPSWPRPPSGRRRRARSSPAAVIGPSLLPELRRPGRGYRSGPGRFLIRGTWPSGTSPAPSVGAGPRRGVAEGGDRWTRHLRRRRFLAIGLGARAGRGPGRLGRACGTITPARAADMAVGPDAVRFRPEIEPVVRWIEETPRERGHRVGRRPPQGAGSRTATCSPGLFLAGIRNIKPQAGRVQVPRGDGDQLGPPARARPPPVDDRLLPLLWALDNFKNSQAQDIKEGDWTLGKVDEAQAARSPTRPRPSSSGRWTPGTPTRPTPPSPALCRTLGRGRDDGAVLAVRRPRPAQHRPQGDLRRAVLADLAGDRLAARRARPPLARLRPARPPGRRPARRRRPLRGQPRATPRRSATTGRSASPTPPPPASLLETIRQATPEDASAEAVKLLNQGVSPDSLWDAVDPGRQRAADAEPGDRRDPRRDLGQRPALHLRRQRRRHDPPARPAPGRRLAADVPRPDQARRRGRRSTRSKPIDARGLGRRGRRRDLRRRSATDRGQAAAQGASATSNEGGSPDLVFAAARRMIFHKGPRQPRLQVRRRRLGGMRPRLRPEVARPAGRRHDVQPPRRQDPRQPPDEPRPRGRLEGARLTGDRGDSRRAGDRGGLPRPPRRPDHPRPRAAGFVRGERRPNRRATAGFVRGDRMRPARAGFVRGDSLE